MTLQIFNENQVARTSSEEIRSLTETFLSGLDVKARSRRLYGRTLRQFFIWVGSTERNLSQMTKADIAEYKSHLETVLKLTPQTVGSYIVSVKKFYKWVETEGLYKNIAEGIKTPRRSQTFEKQYLSEDRSLRLLEHFKGYSLRDFAIVTLMIGTGLRTIEVSRLKVGDICYMGEKRVLKIWGKGKSEAEKGKDWNFVVLIDEVYNPIKRYLETDRRGARSGEPLFTSRSHQNQGEQISTRTISGLCKEGLKAIGLDGKEYTAHSLRHTTASLLLGSGRNVLDAQRVLRHSSVNTTQIYTRQKEKELRVTDAPEAALRHLFSRIQ